jgi:hypothetical protein
MRVLCLVIIALVLTAPIVLAQQRDSLIVEGLSVDYGATWVCAKIWAVVFDSIYSYNIPLRWNAPGGGINCIHPFFYFPPLTFWDMNSDSINNELQTVTLSGVCDTDSVSNVPLYTLGQRINIITLRFSISHDAPPQVITIDTAGPTNFGDNPVFVSGRMRIFIIWAIGEDVSTPQKFSLDQNYPNPFNASTMIEFSLAKNEDVTLVIYDLLGRRVRSLLNNGIEEGSYSVIWNGKDESGRDVPSGTYFYRLSTSSDIDTKRMVLIR